MKKLGIVLVFDPDVPKEEIKKAIAGLMPVIDKKYHGLDGPGEVANARIFGRMPPRNDMERADLMLNEFDDEWGGPVWYIP